MTKILLSGCGGKMGRVIAPALPTVRTVRLLRALTRQGWMTLHFQYTAAQPSSTGRQMLSSIFLIHPHWKGFFPIPLRTYTPAVIATTGLNEQQVASIQEASKQVPIFFSANMSIGISLITELAQKAARVLGGSFDIEIIEKHHNQKIDAPSGTALMLADAISEELEQKPHYEYDRHSKRAKRDKNEIGIHASAAVRLSANTKFFLPGEMS